MAVEIQEIINKMRDKLQETMMDAVSQYSCACYRPATFNPNKQFCHVTLSKKVVLIMHWLLNTKENSPTYSQ
jgi:hypothetical protein